MPASSLTTYRLTPAAKNDLEDIWLYSAKQWSVAQVGSYTDILEDTFERLLFMPEMARERPEFNPPARIHPSAEHLIIYRIEDDHLAILRVPGADQDWQAILRAVDQWGSAARAHDHTPSIQPYSAFAPMNPLRLHLKQCKDDLGLLAGAQAILIMPNPKKSS